MTLKMASSSGEQLPGQVVLVLQGGGALGAYQVGVYQALHEAGVEPDWVIGTSIGAVNGAIIAGNETEKRLPRLHEFWDKVRLGGWVEPMVGPWANHWYANLSTYIGGIPGFFMPRAIPWGGMYAPLGVYSSSWYRTEPLHATLAPLIDFELLKAKRTRLTVGAVNVKSGELRYFDNTRDPEPLALEHVMASGALPPAFPAIAVDGEPYWDGGIYSNTPIEAVLDDHPRHDHVIRKLSHHLPEEKRDHPDVRGHAGHGCGTTMHIVRFLAPELEGDDYTKDIDFTPTGITARCEAGYADTQKMLARKPWEKPVDPMEGVIIHQDAPMSERLARS